MTANNIESSSYIFQDIFENNWNETVNTFDDMNLHENLLRGIYGYGFEKPSMLEKLAIKPCIAGRDMFAQAYSGSGKTSSYVISVLQRIDPEIKDCQALILAPTRELAQSINYVISSVGQYMNITCHACTGGTHIHSDIERFEKGVQIVTGTPGRVTDVINRSKLRIDHVKMLVLEEADEILDHGFEEQISGIVDKLPSSTQIVVFSASLPAELDKITAKVMKDPVKILLKSNNLTLEPIRHVLHQHLSQQERDVIVQQFQTGSSQVLITVDLFARSINHQVNLYINYDLPNSMDNYIHRIGHSGAYGRKATAITLITKEDQGMLRSIEKYYDTHIEELPADIANLI
ncbi:unnamed protein product [Adineta ricciae]|uniref:RNA helicase n=1 Tax=Adineta ricciae TaxID=249248 RepID=A0A815AX34_ADIRI|nr:unnamed protein product [Adineta ricciae]